MLVPNPAQPRAAPSSPEQPRAAPRSVQATLPPRLLHPRLDPRPDLISPILGQRQPCAVGKAVATQASSCLEWSVSGSDETKGRSLSGACNEKLRTNINYSALSKTRLVVLGCGHPCAGSGRAGGACRGCRAGPVQTGRGVDADAGGAHPPTPSRRPL